jgi:putative CRISPR-associated protein (TIGR02619 family)
MISMPRLVISTVGTSLLTNQIDREFEDSWYVRLRDTVNCSREEIDKYHEDVKDIIDKLKERTTDELNGDIEDIREASAELNGIYGLYDKEIEKGKEDTHLLITTDTAQGRMAAEILENFLKQKGLKSTSTYFPVGFSLSSSDTFSEGIASLFSYLQEILVSSKHSQHQICFNLVGSFKAIQGYFNTIGMFYADEMIYVFEGSNEVIKIPKLPVQVDKSIIEPYKVQLAMMDGGDILKSWSEAQKVPKEWVLTDDKEMTLSTWGKLLWSQCKDYFLSHEKLLEFPRVEYKSSFLSDYKVILNNFQEKVKLQETIAKVAQMLHLSNGDTSILKKDPGLQYDKYTNMRGDIAHFRVNQGLRVSCTSSNGVLLLHRYGKEPVVNKNPY